MARPHVLIVEDNSDFYDELAEFLIEYGYSVDEFTDTFDLGLRRVQERLPDIIIMDVKLKGDKNGIDLTHEIRKKYTIPVIFLSEIRSYGIRQRARDTFPFMYVFKRGAGDYEQIIDVIEIALQDARMGNQAISSKDGFNVEINSENAPAKRLLKVPFDHVYYLKSDKRYTWIVAGRSKKYLCKRQLGEIEKQVPIHFVRVHKRYIVNFSICDIEIDKQDSVIYMQEGNFQIDIGDTYRSRVKEYLKNTGI